MADSDGTLAARAALGTELARLRSLAGLTQAGLATTLFVSRSTVANIETGYQRADREFWQRADQVLSGRGQLIKSFELIETAKKDQLMLEADAAHSAVDAEVGHQSAGSPGEALDVLDRLTLGSARGADAFTHHPLATSSTNQNSLATRDPSRILASTGEAIVVALDRRKFLETGLLLPAGIGMELARHDMHRSVAGDELADEVAEWNEVAWEYGGSYMAESAAELQQQLHVDLVALNDALRRAISDSVRRELMRVAALLASITAQVTANLGDLRGSRRWWRTAKQAADESRDLSTRIWIRGREVTRSLYEQRPLPVILELIAAAERLTDAAPPDALPQLLAGKAQALSHTGDSERAEAVLRELRDNYNHLSIQVTSDKDSLHGWSEHNIRFTESYVYSHLGQTARADRAQTAALDLFTITNLRGPAQIELQRALCMVRNGDIDPAVTHAQAIMTGLPSEHRIRPIIDLGRRVLNAVPASDRNRSAVQSFRTYLDDHAA
jgi:DNA-binding XRE family transcriptional regulator